MKLKRYYIDASMLSLEDRVKAIEFIENASWTCKLIRVGCYVCFWEEDVNPAQYPALAKCVVKEIP